MFPVQFFNFWHFLFLWHRGRSPLKNLTSNYLYLCAFSDCMWSFCLYFCCYWSCTSLNKKCSPPPCLKRGGAAILWAAYPDLQRRDWPQSGCYKYKICLKLNREQQFQVNFWKIQKILLRSVLLRKTLTTKTSLFTFCDEQKSCMGKKKFFFVIYWFYYTKKWYFINIVCIGIRHIFLFIYNFPQVMLNI